jgi:hypothetical protein
MPRIYQRTKERFDNATEAWQDIEERTDLDFSDVIERCHSPTHWQWEVEADDDRDEQGEE